MNPLLQAGIELCLAKQAGLEDQAAKDEKLYKNVRGLADRSGKVSDKLLSMYEGEDLSDMGIKELESSARTLGGASDAYNSVVASERKAKGMRDASRRKAIAASQGNKKPLIASGNKKPVLAKEGSMMNPLLQAGVELYLEKQAALEEQTSLSAALNYKIAEIVESGIVKEEKKESIGNAKAGYKDRSKEPTIKGGDCIDGVALSSTKNNARTNKEAAARRIGLASYVDSLLKEAADPTQTDTLGYSVGNPEEVDGVETPSGGITNPSISGDDDITVQVGSKNPDPLKPQSQKTAAYEFFWNKLASRSGR